MDSNRKCSINSNCLLLSAYFLLATYFYQVRCSHNVYIKHLKSVVNSYLNLKQLSRSLVIFKKKEIIIKKMHVLVIIALGILLAAPAHAGVNIYDPAGVDGCKGTAILEPHFKKGDIE